MYPVTAIAAGSIADAPAAEAAQQGGLGIGTCGMSADGVIEAAGDQQALVGARAAAQRGAEQGDDLGEARAQRVSGA